MQQETIRSPSAKKPIQPRKKLHIVNNKKNSLQHQKENFVFHDKASKTLLLIVNKYKKIKSPLQDFQINSFYARRGNLIIP